MSYGTAAAEAMLQCAPVDAPVSAALGQLLSTRFVCSYRKADVCGDGRFAVHLCLVPCALHFAQHVALRAACCAQHFLFHWVVLQIEKRMRAVIPNAPDYNTLATIIMARTLWTPAHVRLSVQQVNELNNRFLLGYDQVGTDRFDRTDSGTAITLHDRS